MERVWKSLEWVWMGDLCPSARCENTKFVYEEKVRTRKCPRCGETTEFTEEEWRDVMTLRKMVYEYVPGKYFFGNLSSEDTSNLFLRKLDKRKWTLYLGHDYVLAKLRRDVEAQNNIKEAMRFVALKMDYDVDGCQTMFTMLDDLEKTCDHVPYMIFDIARENFRIEGWRERNDETIHEGYERNLHVEQGEESDLFSRERWLWSEGYYDALYDMYFFFRVNGDRVACWVTRELLKKVQYMIEGNTEIYYSIEMDSFPDSLIENILEGKEDKRDLQELTVQWYMQQAEAYVYRDSNIVDKAVLAVATRLGWKTIPNPHVDSNYVQELAERLGDPEILQLYETAWDLDTSEEKRLEAAKTMLTKVKGILTVLPPSREKEKASIYIS